MSDRAVDKSGMTRVSHLEREGFEHVEEYLELAEEARALLLANSWCADIREIYWDRGFAKACAFFVEIEPRRISDDCFWVIVGDIPPAYIDVETASNGAQAMAAYTAFALDWAEWILEGKERETSMPILRRGSLEPVEETREMAEMVASRMRFLIERLILPEWKDELEFDREDQV